MKSILEREEDFRKEVFDVGTKLYVPPATLKEFSDYWTEPNKSGKKLRFELEKTWSLSRRITRWANTSFGTGKKSIAPVIPMHKPKPQNEIEELDEALREYQKHPAAFEATELAKWYELLKREKLMKVFTKGEVEFMKVTYKDEVERGKGVCVMMTFKSYTDNLITFGDILRMREKLQKSL